MNTAVKAVIDGRVQGVGYRAFAAREALKAGVTGYAANLDDGSVEVMAEGSEEAVTGFLAVLEKGPFMARVRRIQTIPVPPTGNYTEFSIY